MDGNHEDSQERSYEPPEVEDLPVHDDTLAVAAGVGANHLQWVPNGPSGADGQTGGPASP